MKYTYNDVKEYIESFGYKLLSKEYINNKSKLKIRCDKGHEYKTTFKHFKVRNQRCRQCYILSSKGKHLFLLSYIKEQFKIGGYEVLSTEYKNALSKLQVKCDKGHEYEVRWNDYQQGHRCPECNKIFKTSKAEIEIQEYVKTLTNNVICNDRSQILNEKTGYYLELDIYMPDLNKAIEYNGTYWHSFPDSIERDKIKQIECGKLGIELMVIEDVDFNKDRQNVFKQIKDFLK